MTNGEKPSSQFINVSLTACTSQLNVPSLPPTLSRLISVHSLTAPNQHLSQLPVVSDTISTYKSVPLGQYSLDVANNAYQSLAKPLLPYIQGPYGYVAPYVEKADSLADQGLGRLEDTFPIVKQDTYKIRDSVFDTVFMPVRVAFSGRDYLLNTYRDEYRKTGGNGLMTTGKAIISTELKLAADFFQTVANFLGPKKEAAKQKFNEKTNN